MTPREIRDVTPFLLRGTETFAAGQQQATLWELERLQATEASASCNPTCRAAAASRSRGSWSGRLLIMECSSSPTRG